ncbi:FecR family protein [Pseudomonas sp. ADAK18]|uniref:FecR domain-containing protein n=1 Tax=Pseudomonas sp. ADAK18 TaxID=2730848 RepID=UPI00146291BC|nr:FecR family protein [Pseudomonas sp. ADAK18]QJI29051.1 FecR family protein [Pseudomonas sp. ADAK18]
MRLSRPDAAVVDEAALWMALLQSEHVTDQEREAFEAWCGADIRHQQVIDQMSGGLRLLRTSALHRVPSQSVLHSVNAPSSRRRFVAGSLVVALAAVVLGRREGWRWSSGELYTGTGERKQFTLEDGSLLTLNARSRVTNLFDAHQRLLELRAGELWVDVAKDAGRPFVVQTDHGQIRALGTQFLVQRGEDSTRLVMLHSRVEVVTREGARQVVEAGQSVRFDEHTILAVEHTKGDESAWTQGRLEVHDRTLAEVIDSLGNYRRGILRLNPQVAGLRLSGIYPLDDTDRTLLLLQHSLPIRVTYHSAYWVSIDPR